MKASRKLQNLRNSQQFRRVYEQGQRFHTPFFSAFIRKNDSSEQRFGITVTRKIGCAVIRNRCKRRLREVMRACQLEGLNSTGFDLVVNVKSGLAEADYKQLQEAFSRVIGRFRDSLVKQSS
ncbi:MAG: ribonuclease P protein component [Blastocatellia bacterium]